MLAVDPFLMISSNSGSCNVLNSLEVYYFGEYIARETIHSLVNII